MRVIIAITCLVAAVWADKRGYHYHVGISDSDSLSPPSGNNIGGVDGDAPYDDASYSGPADFEKEFYTFSAPENEFENPDAIPKMLDSMKRNLRVIFIKGPENKGLENAALALAKHAAEQKTAVYVFNKQSDIVDLGYKFNALSKTHRNKPEVHFVKYRTSEDAANAQKAIQSQYDSFGGTTQSHSGDVAPVLNFASQAPARKAGHTPSNSYLPSSVGRRRY